MTTQDGGPAFPVVIGANYPDGHQVSTHELQTYGMSMRDWFAGKELQRLEYAQLMVNDAENAYDRVAKHCYRMADAMLAARKA